MTSAAVRPPSVGWGVRAVQARYAERPLATAAALFAVLAVVRVGGAYVPTALYLSFVLTPAVVLAAPPGQRRGMGLRRPASARVVATGTAVVVASYAVTVGACLLVLGAGRDNWAAALLDVFDGVVPATVPAQRLVTVAVVGVSLAVLVPLAEEVCFRGLLLHAVATRLGPVWAVVVTSVAWALVHLGDYGLAPYDGRVVLGMIPSVFVMGLALGWCRLATGSVLACAVAQGVANLLLAVWVASW